MLKLTSFRFSACLQQALGVPQRPSKRRIGLRELSGAVLNLLLPGPHFLPEGLNLRVQLLMLVYYGMDEAGAGSVHGENGEKE